MGQSAVSTADFSRPRSETLVAYQRWRTRRACSRRASRDGASRAASKLCRRVAATGRRIERDCYSRGAIGDPSRQFKKTQESSIRATDRHPLVWPLTGLLIVSTHRTTPSKKGGSIVVRRNRLVDPL